MSNIEKARQMAQRVNNAHTQTGTFAGWSSQQMASYLEANYLETLAKASPLNKDPNHIIQMAVFQIKNTPGLADCSASTLLGAVLQTSILGLNPTLQQCYYIPRNVQGQKVCQFQVSYTGLIELAFRSDKIRDLYAEVVREGDTFSVVAGTDRRISHIPKIGNTGEIIAAYAVIENRYGVKNFVVLSKEQIEKHRLASPSQGGAPSGAWKWYEAMAKKTAVRQVMKLFPLTTDMATAIQMDEKPVRIEEIKDGEISGFDQVEEIEQPADLENIKEGVEACFDLDSLESFWNQNSEEWAGNAAIKLIFNARKIQLTNE